jgi:hypothetical protein
MFVGSSSLDLLLSGIDVSVLLPVASTQVYRSIKFAAIHDVARVLEEEAVAAALMERAGRHRSKLTPLARDVGGHKPRGPKGVDLAHRRASLAGRFAGAIRSSVSVARRFTRSHVGLGADPQADMASHGGPVTAPTCGVSSDVAAPLVAAQQVTPAASEPLPDCPAGPNADDERSVRVALASTVRAGAPTGSALSP